MLTIEDIVKITSVVATKEDVEDIKKDINGLRESIQDGFIKLRINLELNWSINLRRRYFELNQS